MTCSGRDEQIVYGLIQVGDFICTSQIQLKYGSLMRSGSSGELRSKRICTYPHGPEFSAYICNNEIVALQGFEPYWTFCLYNEKKNLIKNVILEQFSHMSMLVSHDTLRALLEAFHLQRVTELPSSTNVLSWQYYLPGTYPLVVQFGTPAMQTV